MADETWKIAHLVGTSVQFAAGGGRKGLLGHDTTLGTLKMQLDGLGTFAIYARRDAAQSFTGLQSFTNGIIDATLGASLPLATDASKRLVTLSAADFRTLTGTLAATLKGAVNGLAELDANGKVPSSQLPSYVDDVIEVADFAALPVTGETGKIYVTLNNNLTYRWSGSAYVEISASLALGETSSTAYRGDRGATAYAHVSLTNNPHGTTAAQVGAVAKSGDTMTGGLTLSAGNLILSAGLLSTPHGILRAYTGAVGYGGIYPAGVTPGDNNWSVLWENGNAFTFLNATNSVNLQNTNGSTRTTMLSVSSVGVTIPGLAAATVRPLVASTAGVVQAQDAATFRATIGAQASLGYAPMNRAGDTATTNATFSFTRSDAAPVLNLNGTNSAVNRFIGLYDSTRSTGNRAWSIASYIGDFSLITDSDTFEEGAFVFRVSRSGSVDIAGEFKILGTKVVGSRDRDWGAISGTATKGGWDTGTAGLTECKQTIKAMYDAMVSHGLIGA